MKRAYAYTIGQSVMLLALLFPLLMVSCRGGEADAYIEGVGDQVDGDTDGDDGTGYPTLACPMPGQLPFSLESDAFINSDSTELAAEATFLMNENMDIIGLPDTLQVVEGNEMRGTNGIIGYPFAGEWVSLFKPLATGDWDFLGRVQTDEEGRYSLQVPGDMQYGTGSSIAYAVLEGDGSCDVHGVFLWPAGTQLTISDIDGTLTLNDQELMKQLNDQSYDPLENGAATDLMQAWRAKGYMNIYLTARPHMFREPTRQWLDNHGFPFGPVITAPELVFDESARTYKREWVQRLLNDFGWDIVAAYGNAASDIDAYADARIPLSNTFIIGENAGVGGTTPIQDQDFSQHIRDYVNKQPDATQPF